MNSLTPKIKVKDLSNLMLAFVLTSFTALKLGCELNDNSIHGSLGNKPSSEVIITGVSGGADLQIDSYLTDSAPPKISWLQFTSAEEYLVSLFESDGKTLKCQQSTKEQSLELTSCSLIEGNSYKASVVAYKINGSKVSNGDSLYSFLVDSTPPSPPASLKVYSSFTNNTHSSISYPPDLIISPSPGDSGSGLAKYEYSITLTNDTEIIPWREIPLNKLNFREALPTNLSDGQTYKVKLRAVDLAGNVSTSIDSATNFLVTQVTASPYDGLGLPATNSLGDQTKTDGQTISTLSFNRTAPFQGNNVNLSGAISFDPAGGEAIFLRSSSLVLGTNTHVDVNGGISGTIPGGTGANGGRGASGGGAGATYGDNNPGGNGGTSGASGDNMGAATGGSGFSAAMVAGYSYGNGGNGGKGSQIGTGNSGVGGSGGLGSNGAGGGGGGGGSAFGAGTGSDGGGGGAGLIVIESSSITGTARLSGIGGEGRITYPTSPFIRSSGGGGGGVVWAALSEYSGNLAPVLSGGYAGDSGTNGTKTLYQKNSDGSFTQRAFTHSWSGDSEASISPLPFPISSLPIPSTLSDSTFNDLESIQNSSTSVATPFLAKKLTINGSVGTQSGSPKLLYVFVDELAFGVSSPTITVDGENGGTVNTPAGGAGGDGGSGGGAGCNQGNDNDGAHGGTAGSNGIYVSAAHLSKSGKGVGDLVPLEFDFGTGGSGGDGQNIGTGSDGIGGTGGAGSNGLGGGGGGGGYRFGSGSPCPGGGGGGGLVVILARTITGTGSITAAGGGSTGTSATYINAGGGGGGGVIWIAAKQYTAGSITATVTGGITTNGGTAGSDGTSQIFKWNDDNTLTPKTFGESW